MNLIHVFGCLLYVRGFSAYNTIVDFSSKILLNGNLMLVLCFIVVCGYL